MRNRLPSLATVTDAAALLTLMFAALSCAVVFGVI